MIRQTHQMTPKSFVSDLIFKDECYAIIGACFEVYKDKGCGFYEPVYQECLGIDSGIPSFQQSRSPDCPLSIEAEFLARNISPILFVTRK